MAETHDWPLLERALVEHLPGVTSCGWSAPGRHGPTVPGGVVEQIGGSSADLDQHVDVEVSVFAATRTGCWQLARQVDRAMLRGLNPGGAGGVHIDETRTRFGWAVDPERARDGYVVVSAGYALTVRPQLDPPETDPETEPEEGA